MPYTNAPVLLNSNPICHTLDPNRGFVVEIFVGTARSPGSRFGAATSPCAAAHRSEPLTTQLVNLSSGSTGAPPEPAGKRKADAGYPLKIQGKGMRRAVAVAVTAAPHVKQKLLQTERMQVPRTGEEVEKTA